MGRISRSILVGLFLVCLFFVVVSLSFYVANFFTPIHPGQDSLVIKTLLVLDLFLFPLLWGLLARKWPNVFSGRAFKEGGPRLTAGRVLVGTTVILLWVCSVVVVLSLVGLRSWQIMILLVVPLLMFLNVMNGLERRWLKVDSKL